MKFPVRFYEEDEVSCEGGRKHYVRLKGERRKIFEMNLVFT
jgi:hypothetical protein